MYHSIVMYKSMDSLDAPPFGPNVDMGIRGMQSKGLAPRPQTWARLREVSVDDEYVGKLELEVDQAGLDALLLWCAENGHIGDIPSVKELIEPGLTPQPGEAQ